MRRLVLALLTACGGDGGATTEPGRYVIDTYSMAGGVDLPCDTIGSAMEPQHKAFELSLGDGGLMLRTCATATDCDSIPMTGEAAIYGGPFNGDRFEQFNSFPNTIEGPPNPPPPTHCMLRGTRIDLSRHGSTTTIHDQIREQDYVPIADCDLAHALPAPTCTSTYTIGGHLVQPAPRVDAVVPTSVPASACSTPIELDGANFLPNTIVAAAAATGLCPDGSYAFRLDSTPGYCPIAVDAITATKVTAHFTTCPAAGALKLVLIDGDGTYANGRPIAYGQLAFVDTFAIAP